MKFKFWSSTEYSGFLAGLIRELNESSFDAHQCYQISEQSYRSAKSAPARLLLRFRQYVAYPVQLIGALVAQRFKGRARLVKGSDTCVVCTNTFYAPLLATYLHPNVVHLVYDLFPEAMIHSGKWTDGTLRVKLIRWITKQTLKRAKTNVFLGQRLKDYVESIHGPVANAAIIAVGADQALFGQSPKERLGKADVARQCVDGESKVCPELAKGEESGCPLGERGTNVKADSECDRPDLASKSPLLEQEGSCDDDSLITTTLTPHSGPMVLYCGNFGNMHDSETLFEYWRQRGSDTPVAFSEAEIKRQECRFYLFCSGPKRAALEAERAQLPDDLKQQIQLGGGLDQAEWIATMESADVALVTMVPGSETVVMPSKTYSAMMAGQAILAIAPEDSDLVDLIKAADCGWFVEPGDVDGLGAMLEAISSDAAGLLEKRQNAYEYAHAHLGQDALAKDWERALRDGIASS